jgi:hypothetical protein
MFRAGRGSMHHGWAKILKTLQTSLNVKYLLKLLMIFGLSLWAPWAKAQERCATMTILENKFIERPSLRVLFDEKQTQFQKIVAERINKNKNMRTEGLVTIPVVFHVVGKNQAIATDAQLLAQLDTINRDYSGTNGSASKVPSYFQALFGQSGIQFSLAQRTPGNEPTTGIVRYNTTRNSFTDSNENIKHTSQGGADAWDPASYLNVWVCDLGTQILGYSTFPGNTPFNEQGVVVHYMSLPGSSNSDFNRGKTLTHEIGHYFNLYHIWGDDNGSCSGTDRVEDTPNQADANRTFRTGIVTDNCTPVSPGIMYQNYMDYSPDANLIMFTKLQVTRMEAAFTTYRSSLASSLGGVPLSLKRNDASIKSITQPDQRLCTNSFTPQVVLRNMGSQTLRTLVIIVSTTGGGTLTYNWSGTLESYKDISVTLPDMETSEGNHVLTIKTELPNGVPDEDISNDQLAFDYMYYGSFSAPVSEGFEGDFLAPGWDVVNLDGGNTWEKTNVAARSGTASVRIRNYANDVVGQKDYLRSPTVNIAGADSAFVTFQVAAATYNSGSSQNVTWDTLQVLISTDCGKSYTSVYKKWGSTLITRTAATKTAFTPTASEWRQEKVNISNFVASGEVLVAFVNTNGNENDVYLDDVNISTVTVNPNLKKDGFLVTPNPTEGAVSVQFYPHPVGLTGVYMYDASGRMLMERSIVAGSVTTNVYNFDLKNHAAGLYIVKAVFQDRVLVKKIVKVN